MSIYYLICILSLNPQHPHFACIIHAFIFLFVSHTPCLIKRSILVNNWYFLGFSVLRIFMFFFLSLKPYFKTLSSKTSRKILWFPRRLLVPEGITSGFSTFFSRNIQWDFTKPMDALLIIRSSVKYYNKSMKTPA